MSKKPHRHREKPCAACGAAQHEVMYRVVRDEEEGWIFLCPPCRRLAAEDNPAYIYGGTWKASKGRGGATHKNH